MIVKISHIYKSTCLNPGKTALTKSPRQTKNFYTPSKNYCDFLHCDIGFGPVTAHGDINYCILFIDKAT